jgi:hypothetical protein
VDTVIPSACFDLRFLSRYRRLYYLFPFSFLLFLFSLYFLSFRFFYVTVKQFRACEAEFRLWGRFTIATQFQPSLWRPSVVRVSTPYAQTRSYYLFPQHSGEVQICLTRPPPSVFSHTSMDRPIKGTKVQPVGPQCLCPFGPLLEEARPWSSH